MLLFLFLCALTVLAGVGILTAFRVPVQSSERWLLAPAACLAASAVVLGVGVAAGLTIRAVAAPFWTATAIAALYGAWHARRSYPRNAAWLLAVAVVLPVGLMPFDFLQGLGDFVGGPAADGWSYVARGQELWEMPNSAERHLAPLYAYASHLRQTRFISSALLGVLSPLTGEPGDTQAAVGYFLAWALFCFGASCLALASVAGMSLRWLIAFCSLAVISRWVLGAIEIHNYDNLLALSFLPMTMGLVATVETPNWRATLVLGLFLAAAIYTYPEMAIFTVIGAVLSSARRAHASARSAPWMVMMTAAIAAAVLLLIPASRDLVTFFGAQLRNASMPVGSRAGEGAFMELLDIRNWWIAVWGLTGKATSRFGAAWTVGAAVVAAICWALAAIGCIQLFRQRLWDVAAIGVLSFIGGVVTIVSRHYTYGAYKFLLVGWWVLAWCLTEGAIAIVERGRSAPAALPRRAWTLAAGASLALALVGLFGAMAGRVVSFQRQVPATSIRPYRAVLGVKRVIGSEPLILKVDDAIANEWAVYFLRDHPVRVSGYGGPMAYPHVVPIMDKATGPELHTIRYVLSDTPSAPASEVLWRGGPYSLQRLPRNGDGLLRQVGNPNGVEQLKGESK